MSFKHALLLSIPLILSACGADKSDDKAEAPEHSVPAIAQAQVQVQTQTNETTDKYMSGITKLTSEGDNGEAYFSPDGQQLIFQSSVGGYDCDKIWTMNIDGSGKTMVSPDHGAHTCSFFFASGDKILYSSTAHLEGACPPKADFPPGVRYAWPYYPYDIFTADLDGSNAVKITDNPKYDAEPIMSADGKSIVFGSIREGDFDIYTMNPDGSNVKRLTTTVGYDGGPWFSPDGSKIVWRAWHPETEAEKADWQDMMDKDYVKSVPLDLWVMNSDGTGKKRLTDNGATNWAPSWHPDGQRVIFSSNKDDWREDYKSFGHNFEIYLMDIDSKETERITYNDGFDSFPMFSPDGKKLAFGANRNPEKPRATDIYIADWKE